MRKTFVTAFVALLAILAFASCDNIPTDQNENKDGMVTLKINSDLTSGGITGNSRSLTVALAHSKAAYVEVIFKNGSNYYRTADAFSPSLNLELSVATVNYTPANAIMLIGTIDGTLLATGSLATDFDASTTSSVTFVVTSLKSNTSATAATTTNGFWIDTASAPFTGAASAFVGKTKATNKYIVPGVGTKQPCFQVPNTGTIPAWLIIENLSATGDIIVITSAPKVTFSGAPAIAAPTITTPASINATNGTAIGTDGKIAFNFTTVGTGQYKIDFEIPVQGFSKTVPNGLTWKIKGGTVSGKDSAVNGWDFTSDGSGGGQSVALIAISDPTVADITVDASWDSGD